MKLSIVQAGDPVLRAKAKLLTLEEINSDYIQNLISLMKTTVNDSGVGLAAPQIGESLQLAVIEDKESFHRHIPEEKLQERQRVPVPFHVIINPKLTVTNSQKVAFFEGCLSVSPFIGLVPRFLEVEVSCLNERGEEKLIQASGWYARILQHEIDHLNGVLCLDHMDLKTFSTIENYTKFNL